MELLIFGRRIVVDRETDGDVATLLQELALYPEAGPATPPGYTLRLVDAISLDGANNPSQHVEGADGFLVRAPTGDLRFVFEGEALSRIDVAIRRERNRVSTLIVKGRSIQYATPTESAGQTVHELALVPSLFFDPSHFALHSSAFQAPDGGVTLIGGTGGVGKTSLALELCRNRGYTFLADDISVVSASGHVWPNLAFPKIYRYNVAGDREMYDALFARSSKMDRLQWAARGLLGPDKARRRISPLELYGRYSRTGGPLARYAILMRDDVPAIRFERLDPRTAARMSGAILAAEFWHFSNHLHWHRFNRVARGADPVVDPQRVLERWEVEAERVFEGREVIVCRIPRSTKLETLKREFTAWLEAPSG